MSADVAAVLARALRAAVTGDPAVIETVFTEDVQAWSPNLSVTSRRQLVAELADHGDGLSNVTISIDALDVVGTRAMAEWHVAADHTGPLLVGDDLLMEASGRRIVVAGATFAEFRGERICALRNYFDDAAILEQMRSAG